MRSRLSVASLRGALFGGALLLALLSTLACKEEPPAEPDDPGGKQPAARPGSSRAEDSIDSPAPPAPLSSAVVAFKKSVQASKLSLPPRRVHEPRLAFGKGVVAQLTHDALRVFDAKSFEPLLTAPLDEPRAVLPLADGALLAVGSRGMLRWELGKKQAEPLPRPVLLPGADLYPDAQQADRLWIFEGADGVPGSSPPRLSSFRLAKGGGLVSLPELTIELTSPAGGVFGASREGVWLYLTPGRVERFGPGGLRLSGLTVPEPEQLPTWMLPARRLDQSLWLSETGQLRRVLVTPSFKRLGDVSLAGKPFAASVGDQGRLLAAVIVTGAGPRFELQLLDADLKPLAQVVLPSDAPTGADDWVKVVTDNQEVVVSEREPLVAVGGPGRMAIFDAQGNKLFPKASQ
jgi:hypothetical protein